MIKRQIADRVIEACVANGRMLATAESCTGGLIAGALTEIPGASAVFDRGFVTYSNEAKQEMLGVPGALIDEHGAVSQPVAEAMAIGALAHSNADITVSITGVAGPGGGSDEKPIGLVWLSIACTGTPVVSFKCNFGGSRAQIRAAAVDGALEALVATLTDLKKP